MSAAGANVVKVALVAAAGATGGHHNQAGMCRCHGHQRMSANAATERSANAIISAVVRGSSRVSLVGACSAVLGELEDSGARDAAIGGDGGGSVGG